MHIYFINNIRGLFFQYVYQAIHAKSCLVSDDKIC